jgi:hypothetical protein
MSPVGPSVEQLNRAKMVCARCPVRAESLEFALATGQVHRVWGGTSEEERRRLLARGSATRQPAPTRLKAGARSGLSVASGRPSCRAPLRCWAGYFSMNSTIDSRST